MQKPEPEREEIPWKGYETGNYSASTGSTLLADPRAGAVLKVNGSATIDPGATLAVNNGYTLNSRYTALKADQGITGHFVSSPQVSAFYALGVSYEPNAVYYSVTQNRAFSAVARTPNQRATAQALQRLPASSALADAVGRSQTDDDGRVALGLLSGEVNASLQSATVEDSRFVRNAVNDVCAVPMRASAARRRSTAIACGRRALAHGARPIAQQTPHVSPGALAGCCLAPIPRWPAGVWVRCWG